MRFLKTQNTNKFSVSDNSLIVYPKGPGPGNRVVTDATGGFLLPKGTTAQRAQTSGGIRTPTDGNGTIRYNTSTNSVEVYIAGVWQTITAPPPTAITKSTLGPGDSIKTEFGPLPAVSVGTSYQASADNIIVLVENVFQISSTNYTISTNYSAWGGSPGEYGLNFGTPVPSGKNITVYIGFV